MSTIQIFGSLSLKGEISVQGSKNAILPIMAGALLYEGTTMITNVPRIQDVFCMMRILEGLGCKVSLKDNDLMIDASVISSVVIPKEHGDKMRSSIMVMGALIGRMGEAITSYPGGCTIGKRPIDLHLYAFRQLGIDTMEGDCTISAKTVKLRGNEINFTFPSVGATENAILAAVRAEGTTIIKNCAMEPEIIELCQFLTQMGARIFGVGTNELMIQGVKELHTVVYAVGGDRIVAGTYLAAGIAAGGTVTVTGIDSYHMKAVLREFELMGAHITRYLNEVTVKMDGLAKGMELIKTGPYPGFPTDMQSQVMAILSTAKGDSVIEETIFEGRYETVKELQKMGADIDICDTKAYIRGVTCLKGMDVEAKDLRGGAALVIAAMGAEGMTTITNCGYILRGYEDICRDLKSLGGNLKYKIP